MLLQNKDYFELTTNEKKLNLKAFCVPVICLEAKTSLVSRTQDRENESKFPKPIKKTNQQVETV